MTARPPARGSLFPGPDPLLAEGLVALEKEIRQAYPLKAKHRAVLAGNIRQLSAFLTVEREKLPADYMRRPEFLAAYLNYFFPWNVFRQGRLLQGLQLDLPPEAQILDLGAGPLTFLTALWLARPNLREQSLAYHAVDRSDPALKVGRKLFQGLSSGSGPGWKIHTSGRLSDPRIPRVHLLVAANFINELDGHSRGKERRPDAAGDQVSAQDKLLEHWEKQVSDSGAILLVEPAMRATARRLSSLRQTALRRGWDVAAPCTHQSDCPMPGVRGGPWCHFNFQPLGCPDWLAAFSRRVRLPKDRGSLSFLLLTRGSDCPVKISRPKAPAQGEELVRVISEPFDLPGWQQGRYGCSSRGMVLLQDSKEGAPAPDRTGSKGPQPGDLMQARWPDKPRKDRKSGAIILPRRR